MVNLKKILVYITFAANLLIIFYFWLVGSGRLVSGSISDSLVAFGRLSGLLAVYFILIQFLLMGRAVWFEQIFGLDKLSRVHHLNGFLSFSFIIFHLTSLTVSRSLQTSTSLFSQFIILISSSKEVFLAFLATLLFLGIIFFSIYIFRKRLKYETWYFIHLLTYLAIILAWGHQLKLGEDFHARQTFVLYWYGIYIFVFVNQFSFRFFKPLYLFYKHQFFVEKIIKESENVYSVFISGKDINNFKIKPGQFLILRFLDMRFWWQAHPFSLSWGLNNRNLRVTIKNVGDFTSGVLTIKPGTNVIIDGSFGTFTKEKVKSFKVLLIAGGIGITPIRSLIEDMINDYKIVLLYSNKHSKDVIFKKELDHFAKNKNLKIQYFLTEETKQRFIPGRIDQKRIKKLVKDVAKREVFLCGPVIMMEELKVSLMQLGVPSSAIHFEKFSL